MWDQLGEFRGMKNLTVCLVVFSIVLVGCGSKESSESGVTQNAIPDTVSLVETNLEPASESLTEVTLTQQVPESEKAQSPSSEAKQVQTNSPTEIVTKINTQESDEELITDPSTATVSTKSEIKLSEDISKPNETVSSSSPSIRSLQRERFEEESRLELKEDRWYVIGESKPYTGRVKRWVVEGWKQAEGSYNNGIQEGRWKMWWDNGLLRSAVHMKNGNPDGEAIYWYKNGQRKEEGSWSNGKFTATAKWSEAGEEISDK